MRDYTFRVAGPEGPALHFELLAEGDEQAVEKAKRLLAEQSDKGNLGIDLTYGLTGGKVWVNPELITANSIVRSHEIHSSPEPF